MYNMVTLCSIGFRYFFFGQKKYSNGQRAARKVKGSNCCIIQKDFMCTASVAGLFSFFAGHGSWT